LCGYSVLSPSRSFSPARFFQAVRPHSHKIDSVLEAHIHEHLGGDQARGTQARKAGSESTEAIGANALGDSAMNGAGRMQKRVLSAAARAKMSKAARRRWAKVKAGAKKAAS
jgi:hypothetical protein